MIVAWPGFGTHTEQRKELDAKGMIINFDTWPPQSGARPYDVYNPEARDIYWKYLNDGFSSWEWMPGGWTLPNPIIWRFKIKILIQKLI